MTSHRKHRLTAIGALLAAAGLAVVSFMPNVPGYEFPQMAAIGAVVCAAILVLLAIPRKPITTVDEEPIPWGGIWPLLLILFGFLMVMEWLGFFATSFLAFFLITQIYTPQRFSWRGALRGAAIAALFLGVLYLIFVTVLRVQVPSGILL
ncbi:tripartite tricarboxylate transporter TctB family protein [Halomonas daqingensis]|uniref:tripartite tricarboxylate transporter TctB family protein n=1 Tax=Billgrantia desiderata TaxID=52021 RepID=UPI001F23562D|nr:tripartite tricarboxylate transporter TctB family protein [Halomonas desiderata]MCE8028661.1 tripartite tricarboxylate transporter TctB family protein [Halomonas desiderata]